MKLALVRYPHYLLPRGAVTAEGLRDDLVRRGSSRRETYIYAREIEDRPTKITRAETVPTMGDDINGRKFQ